MKKIILFIIIELAISSQFSIAQNQVPNFSVKYPDKYVQKLAYQYLEVKNDQQLIQLVQDEYDSCSNLLGIPNRLRTLKKDIIIEFITGPEDFWEKKKQYNYIGMHKKSSFYVNDPGILIIVAKQAKKSKLAHEMAHIILDNYFDRKVPDNMSYVLGGWCSSQQGE